MLKQNTFSITFFEKGTIPILNWSTWISEHSASLIDNILTTDIFNSFLKKGIIKWDVSDHFPIFFSIRLTSGRCYKDKKRDF